MTLDINLIRKNGELDFGYIKETLKKLEIDGFEEVVLQICDVLFEGKESNDALDELIEFIFDSGVYGTRANNIHLSQINTATMHLSKFDRMKINYGLGFIAMKKRYSVLNKVPFLYPFSYIHRLFYGLIHKRGVLTNARQSKKSLSKDRIDKYERIFITAKIKQQHEKAPW